MDSEDLDYSAQIKLFHFVMLRFWCIFIVLLSVTACRRKLLRQSKHYIGGFLSFHVSVLSGCLISLFNSPLAQTQRRCKQIHQMDINYVQGDSMTISCLTTTHSLESLTVKLHKKNQDKDILMYPDISPASEHQRWSVRKDAGNVTLDLKDIRLSDDGFYDCQVYKDQDCLLATKFNLRSKVRLQIY